MELDAPMESSAADFALGGQLAFLMGPAACCASRPKASHKCLCNAKLACM